MIFDMEDRFISDLRDELNRRSLRNSSYSLRSFASAIGLDPSLLSKILNGKRKVSLSTIQQVSSNLGWEVFLREIEEVYITSEREFSPLSADDFKVISEWYHFAILEVLELSESVKTHDWIAKKLGLEVEQVNQALGRLVKVGLLEVTKEGSSYRQVSKRTSTLSAFKTSEASQMMQIQLLQKSIHQLKQGASERRHNSSVCFSFDSDRLDEAKADLDKVRREFSKKYAYQNIQKNSVYNLSLALFPLSEDLP